MSKQTIYVRHKDEIVEKIIEIKNKLIETSHKADSSTTAYRNGFQHGCEWVLNVGEHKVDHSSEEPAHYEESK